MSNRFMQRAATLAHKGHANVGMNPMVGAVFTKEGKIIAEGYHKIFGGPHAEINAIQSAKRKGLSLKNTTLYVTLEPCSHTGKQGPCTEALLQTGIKKVIYAQIDPNPLVAGKGVAILEKNGILVEHHPTRETDELNEVYLKNITSSLPFVHMKTAITLDGKIALSLGKRSNLSHEKSIKKVHLIRKRHDAILIGIETLLIDNPRLTTRNPQGKTIATPVRVIVDSDLRTPKNAQIFKEPGEVVVATTQKEAANKWGEKTTILTCKSTSTGKVDPQDLVKKLFKRGIRSILIEGGAQINTSFLKAKLVDRISLCITPHVNTENKSPTWINFKKMMPPSLTSATLEQIATDLWITGKITTHR